MDNAVMSRKDPSPADKRRGQRIRDRRKSLGMDINDLAKKLGVSQPAVSQWEIGLTAPSRQKLTRLAEILNVPVASLIADDEGPAPNIGQPQATQLGALPIDVPVHGVAVGGSDGDFRFNGQIVDYVRRPPGVANLRCVYALWVLGDSMSPWNKNGDLIYVAPARPPATGDYVVVQMQDLAEGEPGMAMVKLMVGKTPTQLKLAQHNPAKEFAVALSKVKAIHKVLSLRELLGT
jgi:phage repressor protein C with HTH and peptisase S24 domain